MSRMNQDEKLTRIGRVLYHNPWCPADVLGALASVGRIDRDLLVGDVCFECLLIPAAGGRGYQSVYGLTAGGQRAFGGLYQSPRRLAQALLLQNERLANARRGLAALARGKALLWSISPWQMNRRSPVFDAFLAVRVGPGQAFLAALVTPMPGARLQWYLDLLAIWTVWRRDSGAVPAVLLLWQPPLEPEGLAVLAAEAGSEPENTLAIVRGPNLALRSVWKLLNPMQSWPGSVPAAALDPAAYALPGRRSPFPGAATLSGWLRKHDQAASFYIQTQAGTLHLLENLARFPGLTRSDQARLDPQNKAIRRLDARLAALQEAGLAVENHTGDCFPTENGLTLLAGLRGVSSGEANRYLGWPVRPKQFKNLDAHQASVLAFLLRLRDENVLMAWNYNNHQHLFWIPRERDGERQRRLLIQPDSAAGVHLGANQTATFWLEVDRGTCQGKRLDWKLEKYFLAAGVRLASGKVPPVLYLIDRDGRLEESRLQRVARRLARLAQKYPSCPLSLLLATGDLFRSARGSLLDAAIWRLFYGGRLSPRLVSLRAALERRYA